MMNKDLELYLHIPFCVRKCAYCDFLSFSASEAAKDAYVKKLCEQVRAAGKDAEKQEVSTIFLGGGTPSVLTVSQIGLLMDTVFSSFCVHKGAEISMEMNPGSLGDGEEYSRIYGYKKAGINRLSIGLQSANERELQLLGRIHTWDQFQQTYEYARKAGFHNINIDLMSALPKQTEALWENSLRKTAALKPEHISAYSLIIEEGTPFYERYSGEGEAFLPDEEIERTMYEQTKKILEEYGYHRYEISNYAQKGKECLHNIGYWTGKEYLGLGLGASSYYRGMRFCCTGNMDEYMQADFENDVDAVYEEKHVVTQKEAVEEFMFLGLRMMEGVSAGEFKRRFGRNIDDIYGEILKKFIKMKLMEKIQKKTDISYRLTEEGISVSNQVMCEFMDPQEEEIG